MVRLSSYASGVSSLPLLVLVVSALVVLTAVVADVLRPAVCNLVRSYAAVEVLSCRVALVRAVMVRR